MTLITLDKWREGLSRFWTSQASGGQPARRLAWAVFFLATLTLILVFMVSPQGVDLVAGQESSIAIEATRDVVNRVATEQKKRETATLVRPIYDIDPSISAEAQGLIGDLFRKIRLVRADSALTDEQRIERLKAEINLEILDPVLMSVVRTDEITLGSLENAARDMVARALATKIADDSVAAQRRVGVEEEIRGLRLPTGYRSFTLEVVKPFIRPNVVFNEAETRRIREAAAAQVEPLMVQKGELVVRRGQVVTEQQIEILKDLGLLKTQGNFRIAAGAMILGLILVGMIGVYLGQYRPDVLLSERKIVLLGTIATVTVLLSQPFTTISPLMSPVPAAAMLATILFDPKLGILFSFVISLFIAVSGISGTAPVLVAMVSGLAGVYSVSKVNQRWDLMRAGIVAGLVAAAAVTALDLIQGHLGWWKDPIFAFIGGLASAVITIGSLPFFENFFGVLTTIKLLELSNPNQPLMRRLLVEAPGTYHHSLMVANLAEAATEAAGGDPVLARAGAYYHDIGKLKRPYFFIENQFGGENPHDQISPHLSALIISSHVKDGIELARENNLPVELVDFIREHHGTNLISYFYTRAAEIGKSEHILEEDFRYEGPRPQHKETAIVMLADACEAMVRALRQPTPELIETSVRKVFSQRLADGQLDQSDLTLKDLDNIAKVFIKLLITIFHSRIEYPEKDLPGWERGRSESHARLRNESAGQG